MDQINDFDKVRFDGIFGVGYSQINEFPDLAITLMKKAGIIDKASFSLYLGQSSFEKEEEKSGKIIFGGHDESLFTGRKGFDYFNQSSDKFWSVAINKITVNETEIEMPAGDWSLNPDSGLSFSLFP